MENFEKLITRYQNITLSSHLIFLGRNQQFLIILCQIFRKPTIVFDTLLMVILKIKPVMVALVDCFQQMWSLSRYRQWCDTARWFSKDVWNIKLLFINVCTATSTISTVSFGLKHNFVFIANMYNQSSLFCNIYIISLF